MCEHVGQENCSPTEMDYGGVHFARTLCCFTRVRDDEVTVQSDQIVEILVHRNGRCRIRVPLTEEIGWVPAYILEAACISDFVSTEEFANLRSQWYERLQSRGALSSASSGAAEKIRRVKIISAPPLILSPISSPSTSSSSCTSGSGSTTERNRRSPTFPSLSLAVQIPFQDGRQAQPGVPPLLMTKRTRTNSRAYFITRLCDLQVAEGQTAYFHCQVDGDPRPKISWSGPPLQGIDRTESGSRNHVIVKNSSGGWSQLTVYNCNLDDTGVYTCTATNSFGNVLSTAFLSVVGTPSVPGRPIVIEQKGCTVKLRWDPPVVTGGGSKLWYTVYYRREDMDNVVIAADCLQTTKLQLEDLAPASTYWFSVQAYNELNISKASLPSDPVTTPEYEVMMFEDGSIHCQWRKTFFDDFAVLDDLDRGRFACVKLAVSRRSEATFAIKCFSRAEVDATDVEREFAILAELEHPGIVQGFYAYRTEHDYVLVLSSVDGPTLFEHICHNDFYTEQTACDFINQLLNALLYLHAAGFVHLDVKPENLMVDESQDPARLVLIDFGHAERIDPETGFCKKLEPRCDFDIEFCAPELVKGKEASPLTDVWSAGAIASTLLSGYSPFFDEDMELTKTKISTADCWVYSEFFHHVSDDGQHFITSTLLASQRLRPSAKVCLEHPWFFKFRRHTSVDEGKLISEDLFSVVRRRRLKKFNDTASSFGKYPTHGSATCQTIILYLPHCFPVFAVLVLAICSRSSRTEKPMTLKWTWTIVAKLCFSVLLVLLSLVRLAFACISKKATSFAAAAHLISMVALLFGVLLCQRCGKVTSGRIFLSWLIIFFADLQMVAQAITIFGSRKLAEVGLEHFLNIAQCVGVAVEVFLYCFADHRNAASSSELQNKLRCPEDSSSFISQLLFSWVTPLVFLGWKRPLCEEDIWQLSDRDCSSHLATLWHRQEVKSGRKHNCCTLGKSRGIVPENPANIRQNRNCSSLIWSLFITIKSSYLPVVIYELIGYVLEFSSPIILRAMDAFTPAYGCSLAVLLVLAKVVRSIIHVRYSYVTQRLGVNVYSILVSQIFKKALCLTHAARQRFSTGEVVNLMAVDAQRFMMALPYVSFLWTCPVIMLLAVYGLWNTLGMSVLSGLLFMVLLVPINAVISTKRRSLQLEQMQHKDERLKLTSELLDNVRVLKMFAWENVFQTRLADARSLELAALRRSGFLAAATSFFSVASPFFVSAITFATYVLVNPENRLTAEKAFVCITLFNLLKFPMVAFPMTITLLLQSSVSNERLKQFFAADELNQTASIENVTKPDLAVCFCNASFTWEVERNKSSADCSKKKTIKTSSKASFSSGKTSLATLVAITLEIPRGSLVAVVGPAGSGKSSLLSAVLGEMQLLSGTIQKAQDSVAYVPQQAWILSASFRDNIVLGSPLEEELYQKVVHCCALTRDIEILGDQSKLSDKGDNLSGGQRQRISLARAVYQNRDLYLLDDPLSALDSRVQKQVYRRVLSTSTGMLKDKTRVLVTHQTQYLKHADLIIVMHQGRIASIGSYRDILKGDHLSQLISNCLPAIQNGSVDHRPPFCDHKRTSTHRRTWSVKSGSSDPTNNGSLLRKLSRSVRATPSWMPMDQGTRGPIGFNYCPGRQRHVRFSVTSDCLDFDLMFDNSYNFPGAESDEQQPNRDQKEAGAANQNGCSSNSEQMETGNLKCGVYGAYIESVGAIFSLLILLLFTTANGLLLAANISLSQWSDHAANITVYENQLQLLRYGLLGIAHGASVLLGCLLLAYALMRPAFTLHQTLLASLLGAPLSFFEDTPSGRIMNRCSKDIDAVDNVLPETIKSALQYVMSIAATIIAILFTTPLLGVCVLPLALFYGFIQRFYVCTTRQIKRLEAVTRSPVYSLFQEAIDGVSSIRAFKLQNQFIDRLYQRLDENLSITFAKVVTLMWLTIRLDMIGNALLLGSAICAVLLRDTLSAGIVGLIITYALSVTVGLNMTVRMLCELENNIVSVERIKEYAELGPEETMPVVQEISNKKSRDDFLLEEIWPSNGQLIFEKLSLRYRPHLGLALKSLDFHVNAHEKIGIIGRTGAGKSSFAAALLRLVEPSGGRILIDNVDISTLRLRDLRNSIAIIPQEPLLLRGSIRQNLDPFNFHNDEQLWIALERCHLKQLISSKTDQLQHKITDGGDNFSVGERQLISLARALLKQAKLVILDEATASVDTGTDALIQKTIRSAFEKSTVLTIAHRLNTVLDSSRIMVLDQGRIVEFDTPAVLLADSTSVFYAMAKASGLI